MVHRLVFLDLKRLKKLTSVYEPRRADRLTSSRVKEELRKAVVSLGSSCSTVRLLRLTVSRKPKKSVLRALVLTESLRASVDRKSDQFKDCQCPSNHRSANDFLAAASRFKIIGFVSAIKHRLLRASDDCRACATLDYRLARTTRRIRLA